MNYLLAGRILFVIFCTSVIQESNGQDESNCLKTHPRALHAFFDYYNNFFDPWTVKEDEVRSMTHLFSSRFDRAFITNGIPINELLPVAVAVAKYRANSESGVQLYFTNHPGDYGADSNETIQTLKEYHEMIRTVHKVQNGTIGGLILRTNLDQIDEELEAYESVFGPLDSFKEFRLGTVVINHFLLSRSSNTSSLLQKLKFLIIKLEVMIGNSPEFIADEIISSCDYFQGTARLKNISAEILCIAGYPSIGTRNGVEGSLDGFNRFWCRIVERLTGEKNHGQIIMRSAFDESPSAFGQSIFNQNDENVFYGWWRRNNYLSSYEKDFDEKVESLKSMSCAKLRDESVLKYSDSSYVVGVLVIGLLQFVLIVFLVLISIKNLFKAENAKPIIEDTPTFEMKQPESNVLNDEELLLPSGVHLRIPN